MITSKYVIDMLRTMNRHKMTKVHHVLDASGNPFDVSIICLTRNLDNGRLIYFKSFKENGYPFKLSQVILEMGAFYFSENNIIGIEKFFDMLEHCPLKVGVNEARERVGNDLKSWTEGNRSARTGCFEHDDLNIVTTLTHNVFHDKLNIKLFNGYITKKNVIYAFEFMDLLHKTLE